MTENCPSCGKFMKNGFCSGTCDAETVTCAGSGCGVDFRRYKGETVTCPGHPGTFCMTCVRYYYLHEPGPGAIELCTECIFERAHVDSLDAPERREAWDRLVEKRERLGRESNS